MQKQLAIKIVTIFIVAMMVLIPIGMVKSKVYERQGYLEQAKSAVAQSWTGAQLLMTPVLVIPYSLSVVSKAGLHDDGVVQLSNKYSVLLPETLHNNVKVANKNVFKGIYEVPVYTSSINLIGQFSSEKIKQRVAKIKNIPQFSSVGLPYMSVHISDMRGIEGVPLLTVNKQHITLNPGSQLDTLVGGLNADLSDLLGSFIDVKFSLDVSLRGMGSLSFIQLADEASTVMQSDWPHPEFIGASLPVTRQISSSGFNARWSSTRYSSNSAGFLEQCIDTNRCEELMTSSSGVNFIEPVDIYLQSERSVKYAILFIGLSFITFFIFEHIKSIRIHPIQYAFVGVAISVFYLLLISLAEHIAFHWAYCIGVLGCTSLLLFYVRYMLKNFLSAVLFSLMILILYGLLYVIVQAEDFALLMGAVLVFLVLAILMYVTRKIDWYSLSVIDR